MRIYHMARNAIFTLLMKKTVGARALVIQNDQVLLVKHTYHPGWCTVGGGVDRKETPVEALKRELREEVGAILTSPPELFSVYLARHAKRDDYVIFYIVTDCDFEEVDSPEIQEKKWFALNELPRDISPATQRRIDEYLKQRTISAKW